MAGDAATLITAGGSNLGSTLTDLLLAEDIEPGTRPSYQLCKTIYVSHPLGQKMAEAPITQAQSMPRQITVGEDSPKELVEEFETEWKRRQCDSLIHNVHSLKRVYGIASIAMGCKDKPTDEPLDMTQLYKLPIFFNVLDPLNTAGSLVMNQVATAADFNKPSQITVSGEKFHSSRCQVVMNEHPVYIEYTSSAFGFVGRSVYQRALYPLKSFILTMIADDVIATKNSVLVAKQKQPGSVLDYIMDKMAGIKRSILKWARAGQVLSIGPDDSIECLDMKNVKEAGEYSRGNILKNISTAADMPAVMLENETLTEGFGEGTEDAKIIVRYLGTIRTQMDPTYGWFDNIIMYCAWNPVFFLRIQKKYPDQYGHRDYEDVFSEWRAAFKATWPSLLEEPESERVKAAEVRLRSIVSIMQTLLPIVDVANKVRLVQWACDALNEDKDLFKRELILDDDTLKGFLEEEMERQEEQRLLANSSAGAEGGEKEPKPPAAKKLARLAA
jgi:hypothetical protein